MLHGSTLLSIALLRLSEARSSVLSWLSSHPELQFFFQLVAGYSTRAILIQNCPPSSCLPCLPRALDSSLAGLLLLPSCALPGSSSSPHSDHVIVLPDLHVCYRLGSWQAPLRCHSQHHPVLPPSPVPPPSPDCSCSDTLLPLFLCCNVFFLHPQASTCKDAACGQRATASLHTPRPCFGTFSPFSPTGQCTKQSGIN